MLQLEMPLAAQGWSVDGAAPGTRQPRALDGETRVILASGEQGEEKHT